MTKKYESRTPPKKAGVEKKPKPKAGRPSPNFSTPSPQPKIPPHESTRPEPWGGFQIN